MHSNKTDMSSHKSDPQVHVRRLVEAGYKVGIVRQTETAALKVRILLGICMSAVTLLSLIRA